MRREPILSGKGGRLAAPLIDQSLPIHAGDRGSTSFLVGTHSDLPYEDTLSPHTVHHILARLDHVLKFLQELLVPACFAHVL